MVVDIYPRHRMEGTYGCSKESEIQSTAEKGAGTKTGSPEKVRAGKEKGCSEEKARGLARRIPEETGGAAGRGEEKAVGETRAGAQGISGKRAFAAGPTGGARGSTRSSGRRGARWDRDPLFQPSFRRSDTFGVGQSARGRHDSYHGPHERLSPAGRIVAD